MREVGEPARPKTFIDVSCGKTWSDLFLNRTSDCPYRIEQPRGDAEETDERLVSQAGESVTGLPSPQRELLDGHGLLFTIAEYILIIVARPLNEDRRAALLDAASKVFAERGLSAPTALISKTAKVAEGSLFTYFKNKDDLINALYREIRLDLAYAVMDGFPRRGSVRERLQHIWTRYVSWGVANPLARRALKHLSISSAITPAVRAEGGMLFAEVKRLQQEAAEQRKLAQLPPVMAAEGLKALAEMTMDLIECEPAQAEQLMASGFQMLWGALTSKV